ncbi:MAG: hypothetical protein P1V97_31345, partial [Planctomycetota bacterium]|nr:hypothetical protein [Planctomycetota bacterium]
MKLQITPDQACEFLNELLKKDQEFVKSLVSTRFKCQGSLAFDPNLLCLYSSDFSAAYAGFLGVLNGLFGIDENGQGCISVFVEEGEIKRF